MLTDMNPDPNRSDDPYRHPVSLLCFSIFRANGALIGFGDALMRPLGLTSARWQVLGAIDQTRGQASTSGVARNMGLVRQSVQRIVDQLVEDGLVVTLENPSHRRARLVQLAPEGRALLDRANARWGSFADTLLAELAEEDVLRVASLLQRMRDRMDDEKSHGINTVKDDGND